MKKHVFGLRSPPIRLRMERGRGDTSKMKVKSTASSTVFLVVITSRQGKGNKVRIRIFQVHRHKVLRARSHFISSCTFWPGGQI